MKIHLDLDCYFVSAERTRYPFLKNRNVVVVKSSDKRIFADSKKEGVLLGDTGAFNSVLEFRNPQREDILNAWREEFIDPDGSIRGIVIAKSYEAKKYKIKTGTPLKEAFTLCPDLLVLPSDHMYYQELSQQLKRYLEARIPVLEQYSIDEFFGDLSGWIKDEDTQEFITELRDDIKKRFDLPISIGASRSKWIAKLLTDEIKPYGAMVLYDHEVRKETAHIPIEDFPGIGRAIFKRLSSYGIKNLGELREVPSLLHCYGKTGRDLYQRVCGTDNEAVIPYHDRRGIGMSRNFKAIQNRDEIFRRVTILARYLSHSIVKLGISPLTFYFKIRYEFGYSSKVSVTLHRLFNERFFIDLALETIQKLDKYPNYAIHYIAMNASNFMTPSNIKTYSLLEYKKDKKMASLNAGLLKIRDKYGVDIIRYGSEKMKATV